MKAITRENWKITKYNDNGSVRKLNVVRSTEKGNVVIKGSIKSIYTQSVVGSMVFIAPGYTNSTTVELFGVERGDFDGMFGWTEEFLEESFKEFLA